MDVSRSLNTPTKSIFQDFLQRKTKENLHCRTTGELKSDDTQKIIFEYIDKSRQRLQTRDFLNSRQRTSQELLQSIVSHSTTQNKFYTPFTQRKSNSSSGLEKLGNGTRIGNKRSQIQQAEQAFKQQITYTNRYEYLIKMQYFIQELLTEEFKDLSSLFQTFMKQYQYHLDDYQMELAVKEKELEVNSLNEYERMNKNFENQISNYQNQVKQLTSTVETNMINIHKLQSDNQEQHKKYKELRQRFEIKLREIDMKNKKIRSFEYDIQSLLKKIQYYENKQVSLIQEDQKPQDNFLSPLDLKKSVAPFIHQQSQQVLTLNNISNDQMRKYSKKVSIVNSCKTPKSIGQEIPSKSIIRSESSLEMEEDVQDQEQLNQIELNYDRIIEYRTSESQTEYDLLEYYTKSVEIQTNLQLMDQTFDGFKQDNIETGIKYIEFINSVQNKIEHKQDFQSDKVLEQIFSEIDELNIMQSNSSLQQSQISQRKYSHAKGSILVEECNSPLVSKNKVRKDQQVKQLMNYFNYSRQRLNELTIDVDQKQIIIESLQNSDEQLKRQIKELSDEIQKLKMQSIDDRLLIQDLQTKYETNQTEQSFQQSQQLLQQLQQSEHRLSKLGPQQIFKKGRLAKIPHLGQKVTISYDFQKNQSKQLLIKVKTKTMTKFNNYLPLKTVLKYITTLYFDLIQNQKEQKQLKDQDMAAFIYNYYMQQFGYTKVTEQRFMILVLSIKKNTKIVRVNIFAKFLGLFEENSNYSVNEQQRYIEALEYISNQQNLGTSIKDNEAEARYFIPYVRALSYLSSLQKYNFSQEESNYLKQEFESLKENDPKGINKQGLIDFDLMMIRVLQIFRNNVEKTKAYVINAFAASDLDGNGMCNIDEWLLLNRHIESEKYDEEKLIDAFEENADLIVEEEKNLSFETFSILCMSLELFSDAAQNKFLKVRNYSDVGIRFQQLVSIWPQEYTNCIQKLAKCDMDETEKHKWNTILSVLNEKILAQPEQVKPLLIAYRIFNDEIK